MAAQVGVYAAFSLLMVVVAINRLIIYLTLYPFVDCRWYGLYRKDELHPQGPPSC